MEPEWLDKAQAEALTPRPVRYRTRWGAHFRTEVLGHPWWYGGMYASLILFNVVTAAFTDWQAVVAQILQGVVSTSIGLGIGLALKLWWDERRQKKTPPETAG